jgi:hypothetical protein
MIHSKYTLYITKQRIYLVASCLEEVDFQIIKIDRTDSLSITHDSIIYTKNQIITLLSALHDGNIGVGGLTKQGTYFGIIGIVRFLHGYYLLLVSKRSAVSLIGGHYIYHIDDSFMFYIPSITPTDPAGIDFLL